jgi:hypothetical protein
VNGFESPLRKGFWLTPLKISRSHADNFRRFARGTKHTLKED